MTKRSTEEDILTNDFLKQLALEKLTATIVFDPPTLCWRLKLATVTEPYASTVVHILGNDVVNPGRSDKVKADIQNGIMLVKKLQQKKKDGLKV